MFFGSRLSVGVDLDTDALYWAAVDRKSLQCHLWSKSVVEERTSREGLPESELTIRVRSLLKDCRAAVPSWSRSVASAVGRECLAGFLELPSLSDRELQVAVPSAARRQVPYSLDEVSLTYRKVPPLSTGQEGRTGIFFLAVRKDAVERHKRLLESVDLDVASLELVPMALLREFEHNHGKIEDALALLHVGFDRSHVLLLRSGEPYFYRSFSPAAADFVYAFQMAAQCSWAEAESHLEEVDARQREVALEPVLGRWFRELDRSLSGLVRLAPEAALKPERLYLSGRRLLPGLAERVAEEIGLTTRVDGWERLRPGPGDAISQAQAAGAKIALGVALAR
ncbi:MAG: pilus assembly protein PilM [Armatimonadetes bacterium]|nr:pilus assembly protein PilM [Armatimonadota bacterium]